VFGAKANAEFPHLPVVDGDVLEVGAARLRVLETPGHTPESISIVVTDTAEPGAPAKVLTGDALFIGDVGRPDLVGSKGYTAEQMAGMLYDSLHEKLLALPDETEVYPAHGAGSLCGRNLSRETSSTIGEQKRFNYALKPMSKDEFVRAVTEKQPEVPAYFPKDAEINRAGAAPLAELAPPAGLSPKEVSELARAGHVILDVRTAAEFGNGHVPGALNIGLSGQFASWAGTLVPIGTPIVLVTDEIEQVEQAVTRLARVGLESVEGYLADGMLAWDLAGREVARIPQMTVDELKARIDERARLQILDVRRAPEYEAGHVPGAASVPLAELTTLADGYDKSLPTAVVCASGYRSSAATSLLQQRGFGELYNVVGGTNGWITSGFPAETREEATSY
jgi:rhodanese-related sulfurtransferase/glyoxylase-like metal-dependent hydrolase (beta-lactamase superfamily II)